MYTGAVVLDGTLGWVLGQLYARGTQTGEDGTEEPRELYRRQGDKWLSVGNVSNFKE